MTRAAKIDTQLNLKLLTIAGISEANGAERNAAWEPYVELPSLAGISRTVVGS